MLLFFVRPQPGLAVGLLGQLLQPQAAQSQFAPAGLERRMVVADDQQSALLLADGDLEPIDETLAILQHEGRSGQRVVAGRG